ncbi:MAG TPA: Rrf2 family transcriptional regulator [Candidatus Gastranaerophilaceae bacterium]|nr:Rrf2 family transcriptional regulator [Candidatus Gastranaerophilaceae bacterium]HPT41049.1 Rrf2 family transcriptional regulator [Candidatus Gastranaerophilaceae bacterium]
MTGSVIKISEAASLGLHAMIILAQNPKKLVSVKEISDLLEVSANHLSKVMQRLTKIGFINSVKGYNGGFKLIKAPEKITFLEIYELFDGKLPTSSCLLTTHKCKGNCILGDLVTSVNKQVKEKFEKTKLSDFVK